MSEEQFHLDQIFIDEYPPEAAVFCNESGKYFIDEIETDTEDGKRRFQIKEIPPATEKELSQQRIYELEQYLKDTDWYSIRDSETRKAIPVDIALKRTEAREEISGLRNK